jgi:tetratricopeptide (TPR) repeat protein
MPQRDAALEARESSLPPAEPASDLASVPALQPASVGEPTDDDAVAVKPHVLLRPYVAVPLALAVLFAMLWGVLAGDSPSVRVQHSGPTAERSAAGKLNATRAAPAQSPAVSSPAANAVHAVPALASAPPVATRTLAQTATASRAPASTKQDGLDAVARASTGRKVAHALRAKALAHFRRAEFELAGQTYRQAIEAAPGYAGAYAGLGASQLAVGDARGAISSYEQAIRRSPGTSGFHAALGRAYVMTLDRVRAVAEYRKAVALDPANEIASTALARLTL